MGQTFCRFHCVVQTNHHIQGSELLLTAQLFVAHGCMNILGTVLSQASAHGHSQLKHQKLGLGGYMEEVLEWFNYPHTSAQPRCKVIANGKIILTGTATNV